MKILFLYDGEYPWDIRVEKICNTLLDKSHEVHMVCRNKSRQVRSEKYENINIHRTISIPTFFGKINDVVTFPAFFSPVWLIELYIQTKKNKCEIIIVRDLPMALAAIWVGKILHLPVVLDMAECYPEMLRCIWKFEKKRWLNIFLRNPKLGDYVERKVMNEIDAVLVMVKESRERLLEKKVDNNKIYIVSNTPVVDRFKGVSEPILGDQTIRMLYVGLLNGSRGLDICISGLKKYMDSVDQNITLTVAGSGNDLEKLKYMVEKYGVMDKVNFLGWVDNKKIPQLIMESNVCVVPHRKCSHWDNTIPNKLFDYMATCRAVLVTNVVPMKRIVEETNCGLVFTDNDIEDFVNKLIIMKDDMLRNKYADNGRNAVINKYNWKNEEIELDNMFTKLFQGRY